jgi:nucleoside-diphosphate-sugar epimerase
MDYRLSPSIAAALASDGRRIVITGSGGWLGMATLELLRAALGSDLDRRVRCFGSSAKSLTLLDGTTVEQRPLAEIGALGSQATLVLHLAFLTKDRAEQMDEQAYRHANREVSAAVLDALDPIGAEAVFVASSGAAGRAQDPDAAAAMRLYGALKQADEETFAGWAERAGKTAVITRIFNIAGPHINKHQAYALATFILDALAERPIVVRAAHPVLRGYVAIRELMSLVFALLMEVPAVTRFDTGGEPMELGEVAGVVASVLGAGCADRAPPIGRGDIYVGDRQAYDRLLARFGIEQVDFRSQVAETALFLGR